MLATRGFNSRHLHFDSLRSLSAGFFIRVRFVPVLSLPKEACRRAFMYLRFACPELAEGSLPKEACRRAYFMYYTYILYCSDGLFYAGHTGDLKTRIYQHSSGQVKYTSCRLPANLVYFEKYETKNVAMKREKQLKGWSKIKKINLIKYGHPTKISSCKN